MKPQENPARRPEDVFILGAGFSKAISEEMPVLRELSKAIAARFAQPNSVLTSPFLMEDVELAMTFLAQAQPWKNEAQRHRNRADFLELTQAIATEITDRSASVQKRPIPPWLLQFAHWLHFRKAVVITLNYDTLLEAAITQIPGGDCYPKHLIPIRFAADEAVASGGDVHASSLELLKLHGSVNWRYSGRTDYSGELIQWAGINAWTRQADGPVRREKTADTAPLIIPPVTDKASYFMHHSVHYLWKRAFEALAFAKRIFCLGYSLPATDLTMRFLLSDLHREDLVDFFVVNRPDAMRHYKELLAETPVRLNDRFVGTDPIEPFVAELFTDEFFPEYPSTVSRTPSPVETAIRGLIPVGVTFPAALDAGTWAMRAVTPNSITILLDAAEIPIRLPWTSLDDLVVELQHAWRQMLTIDELNRSGTLRAHCDRNLGPWIAALLEKAGLASIQYDVNRWVLSPAGANQEQIAR